MSFTHTSQQEEPVPVIPTDLKYSQDHLWARPNAEGGLIRVGLTDFAQESLGDLVDVSLPKLDDTVSAGEPCGDIESVKSDSDLMAPVTGTVRTLNGKLAAAPELINSDPYGQGWLFEIEADPATLSKQLDALLDATAYRDLTGA
jgi:glycine cleavage system H protein